MFKDTERLGPRPNTSLFLSGLGEIEVLNFFQPGSGGFLVTSELTLKIAMVIRAAYRPLHIAS